MSATDLSVADPRQLLEARLEGMQRKRIWLVVLFFGAAALFIGLFVAEGGAFSAAAVMGWILALLFLFYGFLTIWQMATAEDRNRQMVQLLDVDPSRIKRIYGTKLVGSGRYSSMAPIGVPESEKIGESKIVCVVVELAEPSRLKRMLGVQKYIARVSPQELLELLSFLRGLAPEAQGPPGRRSR